MESVRILKVGDTVRITDDVNSLNHFMVDYAGKEAVVTEIYEEVGGEYLVRLDVDGGEWVWDTGYKNDQLEF